MSRSSSYDDYKWILVDYSLDREAISITVSRGCLDIIKRHLVNGGYKGVFRYSEETVGAIYVKTGIFPSM